MIRKTICFGLALCFSLIINSFGVEEGLSSPGVKEGTDKDYSCYEMIDLGRVRQNPAAFRDRKVVVAGVFRGWQGDVARPGITRSDWVIEDAGGAIYVAGAPPLDPVKDRGQAIRVWGTLKITEKGVPYLDRDKVEVDKRK